MLNGYLFKGCKTTERIDEESDEESYKGVAENLDSTENSSKLSRISTFH